MKLVSGDSDAFIASISASSRATCSGTMRSAPSILSGVARSAPRSNKSFWIVVNRSASGPSTDSRATPIALFASSTSPIATMRGSALEQRDPSTSPVVPSSPVRV